MLRAGKKGKKASNNVKTGSYYFQDHSGIMHQLIKHYAAYEELTGAYRVEYMQGTCLT